MSLFINSLIVFLLMALGLGFIFWAVIGSMSGKGFKITRRAFIYSLAIPAVLVIVFGAMGWFLEWHEEPEFCGELCHSMEPLYVSYENPGNNTMMVTHLEEGVGCTGCHVGPGWWGQVEAYLAVPHEVYSETFNTYDTKDLGGGLEEESCLKCHDGEVASEPGEVKTAIIGLMADPHTSDEDCADCHQAHQGARGLTIEACNVCHGLAIPDFEAAVTAHGERAGEDCMACHDRHHPDDATVPWEEVVDIDNEFCHDCHVVEYTAYTETFVDMSLELYGNCTDCHLNHNKSSPSHPEYVPYDNCSQCHLNLDGPGGIHNRTGVSYVDFPGVVDTDLCQPCHVEQVEGLDASANHRGLECIYCHDDHDVLLVHFDKCDVCHTTIPNSHDGDENCSRCHGSDWYH